MGQKAFSSLTSGVSGLISEINSSNAAWKTFEGNMSILGKGTKEIDGVKKNYNPLLSKRYTARPTWRKHTHSWQRWEQKHYKASERFRRSCGGGGKSAAGNENTFATGNANGGKA